jgi:hypothetical protein
VRTVRPRSDHPDDTAVHAGWPGTQLQNLHYTYDPVGNIIRVRDAAQQRIFFENKYVDPSSDYTYDASYRLIEATGREQLSAGKPVPHSFDDAPRISLPTPEMAPSLANTASDSFTTRSETTCR